MKVIDYKIVFADTYQTLEEKVREHISKAWQVCGFSCTEFGYFQALIKYEDKDKDFVCTRSDVSYPLSQ